MTADLISLIVAALITLALMPLAIRFRPYEHLTPGVQDLHLQPTSRLGGAVLFVGYVAGVAVAAYFERRAALPMVALLLCSLPVLGAGVWEDITRRLPPKHRLLAALIAALLACLFAGGITARIDVPFIDLWIKTYPAFAIALTCFMAAGACNAFNIIDGSNGLAGGTALMIFGGIAIVAAHVGDHFVLIQALAMLGAVIGFLAWNYPRARVFLGDGGAYLIGFIYAELSIQLAARNDHVSAWFVIMLAAYPIVETLASMYRRTIVLRTPSTQPDVLHLHSLIFRRITLPAEQKRSDFNIHRANARVAPMAWIHALFCFVVALALHDQTITLLLGLAVYSVAYAVHYRVLWNRQLADTDGYRALQTGP